MKMEKRSLVLMAVLAWVVAGAGPVLAGTNQAADPGGGGVSLVSSATITVTPLALSIQKEARLIDGTLLSPSVALPANTKFFFVLYVDNPTDITLSDVRIIDNIVSAGSGSFTVDTGSFEILNSVALPGIDMDAASLADWAGTATWNGLLWSTLTPGQDGDQLDWNVSAANRVTVGYTGTANAPLNVAVSGQANKVANPHRVAVRFQVTLNP